MQHDTLLCLDIETVPDPQIMPPDWPADRFPPLHCHQVVAISFVEAEIDRSAGGERYRIRDCRSGGRIEDGEERLLRGFWSMFARSVPRLVTWNGRGFDMPVLRLRAMTYGVAAPLWHQAGDKWNNYTQRYAPDWHCDLMEVLSDYGAAPRLGLDAIADLLGLPGKIGGHGSGVAEMMAAGAVDQVRAYCEGDVLNLFGAYLRWALLSGRTDPAGHNLAVDGLIEYLARERPHRPHLGTFLDRWQASSRPVPMRVALPRGAAAAEPAHIDSDNVRL